MRVKVFVAMTEEGLAAYRARPVGQRVPFKHVLRSAQQLVHAGEIPAQPLKRNLMGVACDVELANRLCEHSIAKRREGKAKRRAIKATTKRAEGARLRESILAGENFVSASA